MIDPQITLILERPETIALVKQRLDIVVQQGIDADRPACTGALAIAAVETCIMAIFTETWPKNADAPT